MSRNHDYAVVQKLREEFSRVGIDLDEGDEQAICEFLHFLESAPSADEVEEYAYSHARPVLSFSL